MLKTKSIYDPAGPDDGQRMLVTRFYPRGVKRGHFDGWLRELAPTSKLLQVYKRGRMTEEEYRAQYLIEMDNDHARRTLLKLKQETRTKNVTLLCYEPEGMFCHRHIIKKLVLTAHLKPEDADHHERIPVLGRVAR